MATVSPRANKLFYIILICLAEGGGVDPLTIHIVTPVFKTGYRAVRSTLYYIIEYYCVK